ncbi:MAG: Flagellar biosynthesis protein FliR, partial [uncultured Microvirga sp.]
DLRDSRSRGGLHAHLCAGRNACNADAGDRRAPHRAPRPARLRAASQPGAVSADPHASAGRGRAGRGGLDPDRRDRGRLRAGPQRPHGDGRAADRRHHRGAAARPRLCDVGRPGDGRAAGRDRQFLEPARPDPDLRRRPASPRDRGDPRQLHLPAARRGAGGRARRGRRRRRARDPGGGARFCAGRADRRPLHRLRDPVQSRHRNPVAADAAAPGVLPRHAGHDPGRHAGAARGRRRHDGRLRAGSRGVFAGIGRAL